VFLVPKILTTRLWNLLKESISEFSQPSLYQSVCVCVLLLLLLLLFPLAIFHFVWFSVEFLPMLQPLFVFMRDRWLNASLL